MSSLAIDYSGDVGRTGRAVFASMADIANQTFDGIERLTRLNLQTVKTTLAEQHGIALEAVDSRSFDWLLTLPVAGAQAGFTKTLAYWQHVNTIAAETTANNAGAGWEGFTECTRWVATALSDAAHTGTGGPFVLPASDANLPVAA